MRVGDITFTPVDPLSLHYNSADASLSRATMGHSTSHHHYQDPFNARFGSTSSGTVNDDEKNMDQTIATALTQFTDLAELGTHGEDDDTTTIQSIDSITGTGILSLTNDEYADGLAPASTNIRNAMVSGSQSQGAAEVPSSACSVSTAPSTDEASSIGHDWTNHLGDASSRVSHNHLSQQQHHRRVPSWEVSPHNQQFTQSGGRTSPASSNFSPVFSPSGWSNLANQQSTAFNAQGEQTFVQGSRLSAAANQWNQPVNIHPGRIVGGSEPLLPFLPPPAGRSVEVSSPRGIYQRQQISMNTYPFPGQQQQHRGKGYNPPLPPTAASTPPRLGTNTNDRILRNQGQATSLANINSPHRPISTQHGNTSTGMLGGSSRSPSEVLKTLLRKKACLYEPDTSRAVALVAWLVGRELALEFGFFSRQQLQAGVHACVYSKIDSGVITRTKVNRCLQIILNSCFHYIIPRSDGTEESGETMRAIFSREMKNDSFLLSVLPSPWNDVVIDRQLILAACDEESEHQKYHKKYETPHSSPRLGSVQAMGSPGGGESIEGDGDSKRAVLLCFNENVRSAEEVFRCHNEFIRDTAHASHLQLSSNEWLLFFGREASSTQYLWGNVGIPVPYLDGHGPKYSDALGIMTNDEVNAFRTSWCSKRYDHDHELCGFGHAEVNSGWLRRNPSSHKYSTDLCQFVSSVAVNNDSTGVRHVIVNSCPNGINCSMAHSQEEIIYHPTRYKKKTCIAINRACSCAGGEVCPNFHPTETYRFPKKSDSRSARYSRLHSGGTHGSMAVPLSASHPSPNGSPIIYTSPAPVSSYENHLLLPGLQSIFRRHSSVIRATTQNFQNQRSTTSTAQDGVVTNTSPTSPLYYSCFDDDGGIISIPKNHQYHASHTSVITRPNQHRPISS